ncbi:thymidylate kinase [Magnaporthiopsis poae ATCC 64411]|uniref:Thymidylate kinase n=1 Tax=Magnaporthiopsis poae (strain ATCC 64411 / 73-15) TaxID=644358 RepID=A0A0C4EAD2_MAGP6|nr:thymidylate kinase [Magnaporthiopsis poae ATCC 64411]
MASMNDLATAAIASSAVQMAKWSSAGDEAGGGGGATESSAVSGATPQPPEVARGALITLEGLDRSGKTTQVKLLEQRFVELGRKVKVMRFPDRSTPIGEMIDSYLRSQVDMDDHVIHLLFSANRWEAVKAITTLLASGTTVICDRYYHSGIVYSAAKRNPALTLSWARAPEVGLPRPDLVLFLDLAEAQARARGGWGGEVYERGEMQRRVRELFWGLSAGRVEEGLSGEAELRLSQEEEDLHVVDASPSVEDVAEEIWKVVRPRVEAVERGELGRTVRKVS